MTARDDASGLRVPLAAVDARTTAGPRRLAISEEAREPKGFRRRGWLVRRALLAADAIGLTLAFLAAELLFNPEGRPAAAFDPVQPLFEAGLFVLTLPVWIVVARLYGLYDRDERRTHHTTVDDLVGVFHLVTIGAFVLLSGAWITGLADPYFPKVLTFVALAIGLVTLARAVARALCRRHTAFLQNAVIVGAGDVGQVVARKLLNHPEYGINLVGFVDTDPKERPEDLDHLAMLGTPRDLPGIVRELDVERVVIAFSGDSHEQALELIRHLKHLWVQVDVIPRLFEMVGPNATIHHVEGLPLVGLPPFTLSRTSRMLKRGMDVVLSLVALVFLSPVFAVIAALIKLDSRGPVLFQQERIGVGERTFRIYKFRTMVVDADDRKPTIAHLNKHGGPGGDPRMFKIAGDPRVTGVGRFLRRFSLDELPQLVNVLKGEMTLVGPRPLIPDEDRRVEGWARQRLDLKPGMTGMWQVLGRNEIPFGEMVKLDYLYVTTWSLANDLFLLLRTLPLVLKGEARGY
jgi:exopolysaccharide biosynthesis polyprenyl glycosylphosphotransferase